ncbi:MAG: rod shape-determining protein [Lachnospiraceae bacterium]|nr:rod shape-determining protein [Candidatus Colinaster scatohippi]
MAEANNPNQMVFGLDIGTRSIVGTVGYKKGKQFVVVAQCNKEHETRAMLDGQIHDIAQVAETIKDVKKRLEAKIGGELHRVCIAAAGRVLRTMQTHVVMDLDEERTVTSEDIYSLHSYAIEEAYKEFLDQNNTELKFYCVGSSVVRYYLNDFAMSNLENHKAKHIGVDMIATFLPDDVVDGLYKAVELAGLEVANMTLEPIAAIQLAIPERFRLLNIALVDVGAGTSDISITKDGTIIAFGMIPTAGDSLTEKIANHCMVDFNAAEVIKRKADDQDVIEYEDIMGIKMTITKEEIAGLLSDSVDEMATLACDKIKELNGDKSVGAVFVVGGGGMIPGYTNALAEKLGLAPERVALRGKEVMQDVIFESTELKVDSLLVTPIGICLNFYEESNNFIFVRFNDSKIKLYNNSSLTIMDAAMQTDFPSSGFFPKSGPELDFTVNGKARMARGDMGEPAEIKLNGVPANLHSPIKENDIIEVKESTAGAPAHLTISALPEFKAILKANVNGNVVELPKFAAVNGVLQSEYYDIQTGDDIVILDYYTVKQIMTFMDVTLAPGTVIYVNNQVAGDDTKVYENFTVSWQLTDGSFEAAQYTYDDLMNETSEKEAGTEAANRVQESQTASQAVTQQVTQTVQQSAQAIQPQSAQATPVQPATQISQAVNTDGNTVINETVVLEPKAPFSIHVIVNRAPVTLSGKNRYVFVDIFDFISFDRTKVRGTLVTKINGRDAVYMEEIREGDVIEVNWK